MINMTRHAGVYCIYTLYTTHTRTHTDTHTHTHTHTHTQYLLDCFRADGIYFRITAACNPCRRVLKAHCCRLGRKAVYIKTMHVSGKAERKSRFHEIAACIRANSHQLLNLYTIYTNGIRQKTRFQWRPFTLKFNPSNLAYYLRESKDFTRNNSAYSQRPSTSYV